MFFTLLFITHLKKKVLVEGAVLWSYYIMTTKNAKVKGALVVTFVALVLAIVSLATNYWTQYTDTVSTGPIQTNLLTKYPFCFRRL